MKYTPVLLKFVASVQVVGDESLQPQHLKPLRLVITAPTSRLPSAEQTLPIPTVVVIPHDGEIHLKLVPSNVYQPHGRYHVKLLQGTNNLVPLAEMFWIVPDPPEQQVIPVIHQADHIDHLNVAIAEILAVSHAGTYRLDGSTITWEADFPAVGEVYHVTIQPAVTLNELIANNPA